MSTSGKIFLFILLLPFFAAIGHDVYYSYFLDEDKMKKVERLQIDHEDYTISDLGWIWNTYSPETMQQARQSVEPEIWVEKVDPILQYPTMIVGLVPFVIGCIFCVFALILGVWPFTRATSRFLRKEDDYAIYKHAKAKSTKYSRK
jgi:hypothetical protein